jgi:hypothetical protein
LSIRQSWASSSSRGAFTSAVGAQLFYRRKASSFM